MKRRTLLSGLLAAPALPLLSSTASAEDAFHVSQVDALDLPADYWRDKVSDAAWDVLFEEATERPGSSPLDVRRSSPPGAPRSAAASRRLA